MLRFGSLEYRSGLVLTSPFRGFGGLSGLRLDAKGERFIAISDKGSWFTGRIVYRGREMTGLDDVEAAPMLGPDGRPITARGWFDTEVDRARRLARLCRARARQPDPAVRFRQGLYPRARRGGAAAAGGAQAADNKGLEALVVVPKGLPLAGTLIAISERGLDADGNIIGFLIGGPTPGQFSVRRTENFDISDAVLLPSGDLLMLERKFSWLGGIGIRIRRIALDIVAPGAVVDGPVDLRGRSRPRDRQHGRHRRPRHARRATPC